MPFTSKTAAAAGRKSSRKGKPNALTQESREKVSLIVEKNFPKLSRELKKLKGKEYCEIMLKLMEYHVPKLNRTEIISDDEPGNEMPSREERDAFIRKIEDKIHGREHTANLKKA